MTKPLDLSADIIDVRDIIERIEELEYEMDGEAPEGTTWQHSNEMAERDMLVAIMEELKGCGGDEQWLGDWYPLTLISDSYFTDYAEELVKDCEGLPRDLPSYIEIDWEATAKNVQQDYSSIDIDGITYWYR